MVILTYNDWLSEGRNNNLPDGITQVVYQAVTEEKAIPVILMMAGKMAPDYGLDMKIVAENVRHLLHWDYQNRPTAYISDPITHNIPPMTMAETKTILRETTKPKRILSMPQPEKKPATDKVNAYEAAMDLVERYNLVYVREMRTIYSYDKGIYKPDPNVIERLAATDQELVNFRMSAADRANIAGIIKGISEIRHEDLDADYSLNTVDGVVEMTDDGYTVEKHSPSNYHTVQMVHHPRDVPTNIPEMLSKLVSPDQVYLLEFIHLLCLDGQLRAKHIDNLWFLIGQGGTGKSTFSNLTIEMLRATGDKLSGMGITRKKTKKKEHYLLTGALSIKMLVKHDSMDKSILKHLSVNVCDEMYVTDLLDMSALKWMTGGVPTTLPQKYKDAVTIMLLVCLMFSSNVMPTILDHREDAVMRRIVVIPLERKQYDGPGINPEVTARLSDTGNIDGYIHYLLSNRQMIIRKALTALPTASISRAIYYETRGVIDPFMEEIRTFEAVPPTPARTVYRWYVQYAMDRFVEPVPYDRFSALLVKRYYVRPDNSSGSLQEVVLSVNEPSPATSMAEIRKFVDGCCVQMDGGTVDVSELYPLWDGYSVEHGITHPTRHRLAQAMMASDYKIGVDEGTGAFILEGYEMVR